MEIPVEARQAVGRAEGYLRSRGFTAGALVTCRRVEVPPDHLANLLARTPEEMKARVAEMFARLPEEKKPRSHWLLMFHDPATAQPGDPYIATWVNVFDDGVIDLKARMRLEPVHVFVSAGRFHTGEELRAFVDPTYNPAGELLPSAFMREVKLSSYEPGCIEAVRVERPVPLAELLAGMSYAELWLEQVLESENDPPSVDAAVCVFAPNRVGNPKDSSLAYLGMFEYVRERLA